MEAFKKNEKIIRVVVIILAVVCVAQAMIIYKYAIHRSPESDMFHDTDKFSNLLDETFKKEKNEKWNLYDRFFDEDFFSNQTDPFKEMERMHRRLEEMMDGHSRDMFKDSWKGWFDNRFFGGSSDIGFDTKENKNAYLITISIPNLKENKLKINIEKDAISINGEFSQTIEKKDGNGNIIGKHEMRQSLSREIPVPGDVDVDKAEIDQKKDKIIINLPKIKS